MTGTDARPELSRVVHYYPATARGEVVAGYYGPL